MRATDEQLELAAKKIRPFGAMILVLRDRDEAMHQYFAGGMIVAPETSKKKTCKGRVLSVGPGRVDERGVFRIVDGLTVGERIAWDKEGAHDVPWKDGLVLVSHEYVLAKLDAEEG